jgi:hypothetical protein
LIFVSKLTIELTNTLNSIATFASTNGFKIHSAESEKTKIVWKIYHSQLTLILIEKLSPTDKQYYFSKIDLIFDAMVCLYGLDDLLRINDVDKFKKDIKVNKFLI